VNTSRFAFFLALAAALATGMIFLASLFAIEITAWLIALPPMQAKLVQPASLLLTIVFLGIAAYTRNKSAPEEDR
jgi:hypothetical protein